MKSTNTNDTRTPKFKPAFLSDAHKGFEPKGHPQHHDGRPQGRARRISRALRALPKLTAQLGYDIASFRDADVEVLPGHPTTIAFFAKKKLTGLIVVPFSEQEARDKLGLSATTRSIPSADALYEEMREVPTPFDHVAAYQEEFTSW